MLGPELGLLYGKPGLYAVLLPEENKETLINSGEVYHKLL
jgi:hypothetical protein